MENSTATVYAAPVRPRVDTGILRERLRDLVAYGHRPEATSRLVGILARATGRSRHEVWMRAGADVELALAEARDEDYSFPMLNARFIVPV